MNSIPEKLNPLVGASIGAGIKALENFVSLKLGNIVLTSLPDSMEEAQKVMRFCRENKIYIILSEVVHRHNHKRWWGASFSKEELENVIKEAGEFFLGRYAIGEAGGMLYWPKFYTVGAAAGAYPNMPSCKNEAEAHQAYVDYLRNEIKFEHDEICDTPLLNVESSIVFAAQAEAGIDAQCLELLPGDPLITLSAIRGTARSAKQMWGVHIAQMWYGGVRCDEMWQHRWRSALWISYINGAEFIYPESGHYIYRLPGAEHFAFGSDEMTRSRKELREMYRFTKIHRRPAGGPESPLGIVRGSDDGHPGIWNPYAWGVYEAGKEWETSNAERGWELYDLFFRRDDAFSSGNTGNADFSGNPPCGQLDIVPAEGSLDGYKMLIFAGYNRMDDALYEKLIKYVENGGHLLIALSHFDTADKRGDSLKLFRDGRLSELCGFNVTGWHEADVHGASFIRYSGYSRYDFPVKSLDLDPMFNCRFTGAKVELADPEASVIAGYFDKLGESMENVSAQPVLIERKLGKGMVMTLTTMEAPGTAALRDVVKKIIYTVIRAHRGELDFIAGDRIRYSVFNTENGKRFYLYNSDPDLTQGALVCVNNRKTGEILLSPREFRTGYSFGELIFVPEDPVCDMTAAGECVFQLISRKQRVTVFNQTGANVQFSVNGVTFDAAAGKSVIDIPQNIPETVAGYFAEEFLKEPAVDMATCATPY